MNTVDVVLFGDEDAVERRHGEIFGLAVHAVLAIITLPRSLSDIQNFVCDTSMMVDFVKKKKVLEAIIRAIKCSHLSGVVGCTASRDPFFAKFNVEPCEEALRTDESEVFYYVICIFHPWESSSL